MFNCVFIWEGDKMKVLAMYLAVLVLVLVILPYFVTSCNVSVDNNEGNNISLYNHKENKIENLSLEDYVVMVVCAEMPASFEYEALKAQSVAARTYALKKINSETSEHKGADLCTDHAHCQAYSTSKALKDKWGDDYKENYNKVKNAVYATKGEYVSFNNEVAITVFHSCSNGITEKSSDVWGGEIPYLVNVSSPGDSLKPSYENKVTFTREEFINKLRDAKGEKFDVSKAPIGNIAKSSGGNVLNIELFGNSYTGTEIRSIFNLSSTSFTLTCSENSFVFTVQGSGHGVGMSQYGANAMAGEGKSYKEILSHYYPGTTILAMQGSQSNNVIVSE